MAIVRTVGPGLIVFLAVTQINIQHVAEGIIGHDLLLGVDYGVDIGACEDVLAYEERKFKEARIATSGSNLPTQIFSVLVRLVIDTIGLALIPVEPDHANFWVGIH